MTDAKRLTYVWVLLSAITVGTWWLGHVPADPSVSARAVVTIAALAIAAVKVQTIVWHFMEVRSAPVWLRISMTAWLAVLIATILAVYLW